MSRKGLLTKLGEVLDQHRAEQQSDDKVLEKTIGRVSKYFWFPTPGNVIFTLLVIASLLWAQNVGAISLGAPLAATTSITGIPYQGRLADKNGAPLTQTVNMTFRLYAAASGGTPLWEEPWTGANSVQVSDGLFNVMLGSLTQIPQAVITGNNNLFLGITVGTDSEMSPRVQLGSVPFATQALTVPDGSITKAKLAGDVNLTPSDGSISTEKIADAAVTSKKMAPLIKKVENRGGNYWPNSGDWIDVPNATLSFTNEEVSVNSTLLIYYTQQFRNESGQIVYARILVDSQEIFLSQGAGSQWFMLTIPIAFDVTAGSHTIKAQYKPVLGGTATASNFALTTMVVGRP